MAGLAGETETRLLQPLALKLLRQSPTVPTQQIERLGLIGLHVQDDSTGFPRDGDANLAQFRRVQNKFERCITTWELRARCQMRGDLAGCGVRLRRGRVVRGVGRLDRIH